MLMAGIYRRKIDSINDDNKDYGQELILDFSDVPKEFFEQHRIKKFTEILAHEIEMTKGPNYVWGNDKDLGTMHDPSADGISCIQFIMSSSILCHCIDEEGKVFVNIFSCKKFDADKAQKCAEKAIGGKLVAIHNIIRK